MEVLVYEDTKEVEANFVLEDDLSAVIVKKKRRVSFAQTQTIHVIPRHNDIETPPLLNSGPLPSNANTFSPASRFSAEPQSANPTVSTAAHDHPLHDDSLDSSHFTSDMDTGHGSWADDDSSARRDCADGLEYESGCFVHLRHISHSESDDSIVNEVFHDDMTMDATTFSRNLSHFLKFGTTCDLQEANHSGEVAKLVKDCDAQSEEESMTLTKTGAPHQALINPQDVSIHGDNDKSDMSLATGSDRVRPKKRGSLSRDHNLSLSNAAKHSLEGLIGKSTNSSNKEKEKFSPHNISSPILILNPQYDSEISRSLSNTMDISLPQSLPRQSAVLAKIDGNSQTPPMSRRPAGVGQAECDSYPSLNAPRFLEDILHRLKNTSYIKVGEAEEDYMVQPLPIKLQTLSDYLEFSCNTQPQVSMLIAKVNQHVQTKRPRPNAKWRVDWLNKHIQELEVKLLNAKKRNTEVISCNASAQFRKRSVESFYASRSKFASMHSLAKKGWILWKLDAQRQVLLLLRESKENLMKEVEDATIIGQQVMDLKESYSQLASKVEFDKARYEAIHNFAATKGADQAFALHQGEEKARGALSVELKDHHHLYQGLSQTVKPDLRSCNNRLLTFAHLYLESIYTVHGLGSQIRGLIDY
ncbi:hypothetical protein L7F22_036739 [Adiantum nelumboides]|nr:hypothetical protein [Adiantum nelumboides]